MKKSDKKIDNILRLALTEVCETALEFVPGFQWLTHVVKFPAFPDSLLIVCVFETNLELDEAKCSGQVDHFARLIDEKFHALGIVLKQTKQHIRFDSEENCEKQNGGNWKERFQSPRF